MNVTTTIMMIFAAIFLVLIFVRAFYDDMPGSERAFIIMALFLLLASETQ